MNILSKEVGTGSTETIRVYECRNLVGHHGVLMK